MDNFEAIQYMEDIIPLTEFRSKSKEIVDRVKKTGRPTVLTQHGKTAVLIVNPEEYQKMRNEIETLRAINQGLQEKKDGKVIPDDRFWKDMEEYRNSLLAGKK